MHQGYGSIHLTVTFNSFNFNLCPSRWGRQGWTRPIRDRLWTRPI